MRFASLCGPAAMLRTGWCNRGTLPSPARTATAMTKVLAPFAIAVLQMCCVPPALAANCEDDARNMSEVRACLAGQNESAVKQAYAELSLQLKARLPQAVAALEESQRHWEQFAHSSCGFYAQLNSATAIREDARANCLADFSRARVRTFKAWQSQLDKKP